MKNYAALMLLQQYLAARFVIFQDLRRSCFSPFSRLYFFVFSFFPCSCETKNNSNKQDCEKVQ
jgi:hypothetical protein